MTDNALDVNFATVEDCATEIDFMDPRHDPVPSRPNCTLITLGDSASAARLGWVQAAFGAVRTIRYAQSAMDQHAPLLSGTDFLVVSGRDVPRIRQITRDLGALAANRPSICVVNNLDAPRCAALRGLGFDDVFDIRKTAPAEASHRLHGVAQWYRQNTRQLTAESEALSLLCATNRLTRMELAVFTQFVRSPDYRVDNDRLRLIAGAGGQPAEMSYVRVIISGIRKKLRDGVAITNMYDKGYVLIFAGSAVLKFAEAAA
jgi:hypothetical protein